MVQQFSKILNNSFINKPLIDLLSFVLTDGFAKLNYNIADEMLKYYDPIIIKALLKEKIPIDFKLLVDAIFSIPHKDKHFPRKIFSRVLGFLLK